MPRNMALYWFIPALVNSKVGSESGTTEEEGTACGVSSFDFPLRVMRAHQKYGHFVGSSRGKFLVLAEHSTREPRAS